MGEHTDIRRFEEIVLPHLNAGYNLARWLIRNDEDAEDVVQEAFLRAFKFFNGFRGDHGRAWLLRIVRNTCYTWRQQNRDQELNTPFDEHADDVDTHVENGFDNNPEAILSRRDDVAQLNEALGKLPVHFREMIVLKDLEDFSYKEIAEITAVPIGTVMSRLARGRKLLMTHLITQTKQEDCDAL